jgi:hypothetical protein
MPKQLTPEDAAAAVGKLPRARMAVAPVESEPAAPAAPTTEAEPAPFAWTDATRAKLVREYVDSGDLLGAQKAVGCTPSNFLAETRCNGAFRAVVEAARKDARNTLLLRAQAEALDGNDKLLTVFLKESEEDDSLRDLSDAQLSQRINGLLTRVRARLETQGWTPCESCKTLRAPT